MRVCYFKEDWNYHEMEIIENKEPMVPGAHLTYPTKKSVENI